MAGVNRNGGGVVKQVITPQKGGALNDQERLDLCRLLVKAGYTVRISTVKNGNTTAKAVEYWREGNG